ncbi:MAG: hypothetical protein JOZ07_16630, partial [Solirubrobacterales bacterium]|nr:hypothetical protein [Solirubrobacterales bacterium]
RAAAAGLAIAVVVAATAVFGFPYLSTREVSAAQAEQARDPSGALARLRTAGSLNPLDSTPGRQAGAIALATGNYVEARRAFAQATAREPGGWFSWLGAGLAASAQGHRAVAHHDFSVAYSINRRQPAVIAALDRVDTRHPLTSAAAFKLLVLVQ